MANVFRIPKQSPVIYLAYVNFKKRDADLKRLGVEWVHSMTDEPLRSMLATFIESEQLTVERKRRWWFRDPPKHVIRSFGMGQEEERRYKDATHVITVVAEGHYPHTLGAFAVASGVANAFDGVVVDPHGLPRVLAGTLLKERLSPDGSAAVSKWIVCPFSASDDGLGWMTTTGMGRFGVPNLEMRHIPTGLDDALLSVMNAVAQHVLDAVLAEAPAEIALDEEFTITQSDLARAMGRDTIAAKQTTVRLSFDGVGRNHMEPFIAIGPPMSFKGTLGEWYYAMLDEFLGKPRHPAPLTLAAGDNALERARLRAIAEWPGIRSRFARGLSPSQSLFVKYGFPVSSGKAFLWVGVSKLDAGRITGTLANDGPPDADLKAGTQIVIDEQELSDWVITEGEQRREGGYSIEVLQARQRT
jgi:hypothetical protein